MAITVLKSGIYVTINLFFATWVAIVLQRKIRVAKQVDRLGLQLATFLQQSLIFDKVKVVFRLADGTNRCDTYCRTQRKIRCNVTKSGRGSI